jgi:hypothetical protein
MHHRPSLNIKPLNLAVDAVGARLRPGPKFLNDLNEAKRLNDWNDWNWLRFRAPLDGCQREAQVTG